MRILLSTISVLLTLPLTAFASGPTTVPTDPATIYKHEPSGMSFPTAVGEFARGEVHAFDPEIKDVAVAYNHRSVRIVVTAYAYPAAGRGTLEQELKNVGDAVVNRNAGAKKVAEGDRKMRQGDRDLVGKEWVYQIPDHGGRGDLLSHAILFRCGQSSIKFRITYTQDLSDTAEKQIAAFLEGLTLPE